MMVALVVPEPFERLLLKQLPRSYPSEVRPESVWLRSRNVRVLR
jgi:hypothetical protein